MEPKTSKSTWSSNYYEASLNLIEGENNYRFTIYPTDPSRHLSFKITRSTPFHILGLVASLCLLFLTVFEPPAISYLHLKVHGIIEITTLLLLLLELLLKFKWQSIKSFVSHKRTTAKAILVVVMLSEAITVMVRQTSHFRVTRAFRPLFLLDSFYCRNVRRVVRQILQSLTAILNIFILLIFYMFIFSILGFFLFSNNPNDIYFQDLGASFISLFVLMTTANFPDVMLPAYKVNKWSALFFIIYICTEIFTIMNMFLAIIYGAFIQAEKDKFKKLFMHKRNGCKLAYLLLVSNETPDGISLKHFKGCLKRYKPKLGPKEVYLTFKSLNVSGSGVLSMEEFMNVYEYCQFSWKERHAVDVENINCCSKFRMRFKIIVMSKWFNYVTYGVILANFIWILFASIRFSILKNQSGKPGYNWEAEEVKFYWVSVVIVFVYMIEALIKIAGFGLFKYLEKGWNKFDFAVTIGALIGIIMHLINNYFYYIIIVGPLRVLGLLSLIKGFQNIFGTLRLMVSRIFTLAVVLLVLYYFFAIIGMEIFAPYTEDLKNCCVNTSVEAYFVYSNGTGSDGYFYLCSFENLISSGVTLFSLNVVNNWWIIMEGYASVVSPWSRIYFLVFYLTIMVVMSVVVAFILESYFFREQFIEEDRIQKVVVAMTDQEFEEVQGLEKVQPFSVDEQDSPDVTPEERVYDGVRNLKKSDFSMKMYQSDVEQWRAEPF